MAYNNKIFSTQRDHTMKVSRTIEQKLDNSITVLAWRDKIQWHKYTAHTIHKLDKPNNYEQIATKGDKCKIQVGTTHNV